MRSLPAVIFFFRSQAAARRSGSLGCASLQGRVLLAAACSQWLVAAPALAQDVELQRHELILAADIAIEQGANTALLDAQYTFTPGGIDRQDEVIPALRRFVRHPSAAWFRIGRKGSTAVESSVGVAAGGVLHVLDGRVYGSGEVGFKTTEVIYAEANEGHYNTVPFRLEIGGRPLDLLSLGAFYAGDPIVGAQPADAVTSAQTTRAGNDNTIGGVVALSTPDDRVYVRATGFFRFVNWTFSGYNPGDMTIRGPGGTLELTYQLNAEFSLGFRAALRRENWVTMRQMDATIFPDTDVQVWNVTGVGELVYWWRAKYAFRFFLGGGYEGEPPLINVPATGLGKFGVGLIARF